MHLNKPNSNFFLSRDGPFSFMFGIAQVSLVIEHCWSSNAAMSIRSSLFYIQNYSRTCQSRIGIPCFVQPTFATYIKSFASYFFIPMMQLREYINWQDILYIWQIWVGPNSSPLFLRNRGAKLVNE